MLSLPWFVVADIEFAESTVLQNLAVGAHGLLEDFL